MTIYASSRLSILVTLPPENCFLYIILTPAVGALLVEISVPVPTPTALLDRGKEVAS